MKNKEVRIYGGDKEGKPYSEEEKEIRTSLKYRWDGHTVQDALERLFKLIKKGK